MVTDWLKLHTYDWLTTENISILLLKSSHYPRLRKTMRSGILSKWQKQDLTIIIIFFPNSFQNYHYSTFIVEIFLIYLTMILVSLVCWINVSVNMLYDGRRQYHVFSICFNIWRRINTPRTPFGCRIFRDCS